MVTIRELEPDVVALILADGQEAPMVWEGLSRDGRLHLEDVPPLDEFLTPDICARNVLLSMEDVVFVDSRSIGWLLAVHDRFRQGGGKLTVHSIRPQAQESLMFLHLNDVFNIVEDEAAALEAARRIQRTPRAAGKPSERISLGHPSSGGMIAL